VPFDASSSGLGDIAIFSKFRFKQFGPEPTAGGKPSGALAAAATIRLPTGDEDGLRGLGVGRSLFSVIGSASFGRFSPHGNVGYEFWTSRVTVPRDFQGLTSLAANAQIEYTAGVEIEATRSLTILGDVLGRYLRGTGQVDYQPYQYRPNQSQVQGADALVAVPNGVSSVILAPGVKWNFFQNALITVNALIPVNKNGLRDRFTPVIGIDWGF